MNIAITGSTGFIGSALLKQLSNQPGFTLHPFDKNKYSLTNIDSLKKFVENKDVIIHLAGITNSHRPEECYKINALGTQVILEALSLYGNKKTQFILSSSFAVYEESPVKEKLNEKNTKTLPRNHYGLSKKIAEDFVNFYNRKNNIPTRILRISNPYGPANKKTYTGVIQLLIENINNGTPITINGNGNQLRDFIFLQDIIDAISKTIEYKGHSLLVNICSGKGISIIEIVKKIESLLDKKAIVKFNENNNEKGYWVGDSALASEEINFNTITDINDGLKKTIQSYLSKKYE